MGDDWTEDLPNNATRKDKLTDQQMCLSVTSTFSFVGEIVFVPASVPLLLIINKSTSVSRIYSECEWERREGRGGRTNQKYIEFLLLWMSANTADRDEHMYAMDE